MLSVLTWLCAALTSVAAGPVVLADVVVREADLAQAGDAVRDALLGRYGELSIGRVSTPWLRACEGVDCISAQARKAGAQYVVVSTLWAHRGDLVLALELRSIENGTVLATVSNSAPAELGAGGLDVAALLDQVLTPLLRRAEPPRDLPVASDIGDPTVVDPVQESSLSTHEKSEPEVPCLSARDVARYRAYRGATQRPLSPRAWATQQNHESGVVNFLWIAPPAMLVGGVVTGLDGVAIAGAALLPMAVLAAILDAADIGEVEPCEDLHR